MRKDFEMKAFIQPVEELEELQEARKKVKASLWNCADIRLHGCTEITYDVRNGRWF